MTDTSTTANTSTTTPPTTNIPGTAPGTLSSVPGILPGTSLTPDQMQAVTALNVQNSLNPALSAAERATPVNQQVQPGEMLQYQNINPTQDNVNTNANIPASTVATTAQAAAPTPITAATYNATMLDPATLANTTHAVTAALPDDALVSNQLKELLTPDANGNLPSWVQPAVTNAQQLLAGRGIDSSTMAGQAITAAILTAAIPVATANANTVYNAWSQNLSNEQQAAMQNGASMVQAMLSNQGAANAAANFNATSINQTNQFMANLAAQINQSNVAQTNAMAQFNATQKQTAATASTQLQAQLDEFNANLANQREQFNTQNAIIVQQSNAEYLRQVNTANTAVQNQDNQLNAQNAMNLSEQAMANLQTQFNDTATMLYNSNMTAEQQSYAMTYLSQQFGLQDQLNKNIISEENGQQVNQAIGTLAANLFSPVINSAGQALGSGISNLFSSSGNGTAGAGQINNTAADQAGYAANAAGNGNAAYTTIDNQTGGANGSGGILSGVSNGISDAYNYVAGGVSDAYNYIANLF